MASTSRCGYKMNLGDAGKLTGQLNWTHVNKFERTDVDGNTFDYAGTHGPLVQSAGARHAEGPGHLLR